jgi:hypothetical protein
MFNFKDNSKQYESIEDFLKDNNVLLTALGIFLAFIVFTKNLTDSKIIGTALSFLSFGGLILIWFEIWRKFPKKPPFILDFFRLIFLWGMGLLTLYWLLEFRSLWHAFLFFPMTLLTAFVMGQTFLPLVRKWKFTRKILGIETEKKNVFHKVIRGMAWFIIIFFSLYFGLFLSMGANAILDLIKKFNL